MTKKVILVASDAGNIGKTYIASLILETLRLYTEVDAYVCDSKFQGLYERYGNKDKDGIVLPAEKQNPSTGVGFLDISNPSQKSKFATCLGSNAEFMLFDLPANSTLALTTSMGTENDFIDFMEFDDAQPIFVCPIKDEKSITSYVNLRKSFPKEKFVLFINGGAIKAEYGLDLNKANEVINGLKKQFANEVQIVLEQEISKKAFDLLKNKTFREVFTPRAERKNAEGGYINSDDSYLSKDRGDQFALNRMIPEATQKISDIFLPK